MDINKENETNLIHWILAPALPKTYVLRG